MGSDHHQGPDAGRVLAPEREFYDDPQTNARITRLTSDPETHSRHLYFTENGWYDDQLLVRSDRSGTDDLYAVALDDGMITQLTDLPRAVSGVTRVEHEATAVFWHDDSLLALDLESLTVTALYNCPAGYEGSIAAGTADGERAVVAISERVDVDHDGDRDAWIAARSAAAPRSQVLSVPFDGGNGTVHVDANCWLGHVNASPTRPELVTYCEEGPWEAVDRIWGLDLATNETWRIRSTGPDEAVGHEYWLADGEQIGYHGWRGTRADPDAFFGHVRYDGENVREASAPDIYTHFHSNSRALVVGDGTYRGAPSVLLWEWNPNAAAYETPRKLATHGWSGDDDVHPHSRLSPESERVVFDSSRGGTSDVYLVSVPDDPTTVPVFDGTG
ncbi:oligogalacturonate lyase family protein [Halocatena pleomorpha]|uniref:Oligogalacturonate lyase domain-containing protein n=1 Tax=Halocatena pleomorpha TaxID=1785090 RepID=A0A3P3RBM9_9EURY|nr:oligogalacturonate lyase family protein [Halocatena pleomorpha]RRJ30110.1 hypothetical protein EIK79_11045 [Halocatena pleomorpha]